MRIPDGISSSGCKKAKISRLDPLTSFGLPPNLTAEDPSGSFIMKGLDIGAAALLSELGFLASPAGTHVQTAEMGNQSLNSLALISARYTLTSVDVMSKLAAMHLLVVCQALDLRVISLLFLRAAEALVSGLALRWHARLDAPSRGEEPPAALRAQLSTQVRRQLDRTTTMDAVDRFALIAESLQPILLRHTPAPLAASSAASLSASLADWTSHAAAALHDAFVATRDRYLRDPDPTPYLGGAACRMHAFVRRDLRVPFLTNAVLSGPEAEAEVGTGGVTPTVGTFVTRLYEALRSGALYVPAMQCLREAAQEPGVARRSKL